jgi:hypothetical protein
MFSDLIIGYNFNIMASLEIYKSVFSKVFSMCDTSQLNEINGECGNMWESDCSAKFSVATREYGNMWNPCQNLEHF